MVRLAKQEGLTALLGDAREAHLLEEHPDVLGMGHLLALTDNEDLNLIVCSRWESLFGAGKVFRWGSANFRAQPGVEPVGSLIWSSLPKPSSVSADLEQGDAELLEEAFPNATGLVLLALNGQGIELKPQKQSDFSKALSIRGRHIQQKS